MIQQINPMYVNFAVSLEVLKLRRALEDGQLKRADCRCCQRESGDG
jgi:hypothetical protein